MNIVSIISKGNSAGIPFPMVRDPKTHKGSVTCTMVVVSFAICALGVLGKLAGFLGVVETTQAHWLLTISLGAYLGRRLQGANTKKLDSASDVLAQTKSKT